jgi:parallel beta-helix repeat protein
MTVRNGLVFRLILLLLVLGQFTFFPTQPASIDIRSYGARCDGSDDAAAVNAAFNAVTDFGRIEVPCLAAIGPAGIHLLGRTGVTVEGVGGGGFAARAVNSDHVLLDIEKCDQCAFRNLQIDGKGLALVGLSILSSNNATVEGNVVANIAYPASAAILGQGNHGNRYNGNTVVHTGVLASGTTIVDGVRGIWLGNPADPLIEWNAVITNNTFSDIGASAIAVNGVGATVCQNLVDGTLGAGIKIAPPPGKGGQTVIQRNTLRNNRFHGVQIEQSDAAVLIRKNVLDQNDISGVYSSGGAFVNSDISENQISRSGQAGIYLYDANGVSVSSNEIVGIASGNGIILEADYPGAIGNVQVQSNTITQISGNGIALWGRGGTIRSVAIATNAVSNTSLYGVDIEEQTRGSVSGVTLTGNCFAGDVKGTLLDLRTAGALTPPSAASSCALSRHPRLEIVPQVLTPGLVWCPVLPVNPKMAGVPAGPGASPGASSCECQAPAPGH